MTEFELELARFCKALQAELAKPASDWFDRDFGLCENIYQWAGGGRNHHESQALQNQLSGLFMNEFGNGTFPFESGADLEARWWSYNAAATNDRLYANPRRLAFITKWAALAP
jgi:hypothetical protein